jgi:hypothetical protein
MTSSSEIESDITKAKLDKSKAEALMRLHRNKDFDLVIGSYLTDYALSVVNGIYESKTEFGLNEVTKTLSAISYLKGYLDGVARDGDTADYRIIQSELELDSLRAEEMQ